jgi:hypothetical protein
MKNARSACLAAVGAAAGHIERQGRVGVLSPGKNSYVTGIGAACCPLLLTLDLRYFPFRR